MNKQKVSSNHTYLSIQSSIYHTLKNKIWHSSKNYNSQENK